MSSDAWEVPKSVLNEALLCQIERMEKKKLVGRNDMMERHSVTIDMLYVCKFKR